jgi:hypothetical protein
MTADNTRGILGSVDIALSDAKGKAHFSTPSIMITVATPVSRDATLSDCEQALLAAALGVLGRAGRETAESLHAVLRAAPG